MTNPFLPPPGLTPRLTSDNIRPVQQATTSSVRIVPLPRNRRGIARFLQVPYPLYANDPHWVAPLLMDLKKVFTPANPLFEHADMQLWVATQAGRDIGRIAALVDQSHNDRHREQTAFFGFYECSENPDAAHELFLSVFAWARARGLSRILGPANPTTNDECGLLVRGFDSRPAFMMPYNPPRYAAQFESAGLSRTKDLLAFHIDIAQSPLDRLNRLASICRRRHPELSFRPVRRRTLKADLALVKEVYNAAWEDNWGFVPMTDAEIDFLADRLKPLLVEGLVWLAETAREPVAFMLAVPDFNEALQPLRGRLLSPALPRFLSYLLGRRHARSCRVMTLGVKEGWRGRGLEAVMLSEGFKVGIGFGFTSAEASWVLEENTAMCRVIESLGGVSSKTYRLYDRAL